ncbi:MAG TPA: alpha/beta hydrolase-fold protein [Gemmatimonadaceae bacterium]|nr:alpha/beta hydrolase-fold protein [Gemmatimonadaceae bacterium]
MRFPLRAALSCAVLVLATARDGFAQRVEVRYPPSLEGPRTGRVFVVFARDGSREPRLQAGSYGGTAPMFGADVADWRPGAAAVISPDTLGYPYASLRDLPAGEYTVQAVLNVYTKVTRADGHTLWVHWDQWEGQKWNRSPGNLISEPMTVRWDPKARATIRLTLSKVIPPIAPIPDTKWVKRIRIKSPSLTKWWGHDTYIGATVLLPKGFDEEPGRRYPVIYQQGHFGEGAPFGFVEQPGSETPEQREARLKRSAREPGWMFAESWRRDDMPRFVAVTWQHPTPWYDDSYAVNSVNQGPYQDALLNELVPELERRFRLLPEPNARFLTGGSTGGWECLVLQIQRPDFFGGGWCLYPDPVDFRRNQLVDAYADTNAFVPNGAVAPVPERYMMQTEEGQPLVTNRQMSQLEAVLGSKARSGQQFDAFDASYGPVGADGYPRRLWDRRTGTIDKEVAAYWRDHFDLTLYLKKHWARIGPQLTGKVHTYVGDMDNHYLQLAVYLMEEEVARLDGPKANFTFEYGRPKKPHGWQPFTNAELIRMIDKFRQERRVQP